MKKIIIFILSMFMVVGCGCTNDKAQDAVENYLNNYKNLDSNVVSDIDKLVDQENLNDKQKDTYKDILKRQYSDLMYTIEDESYEGDSAKVTVKITVYDLYKASKKATDDLNGKPEDYLTDGEYDKDKYMDHKLELMKDIKETVNYNLVFNVKKNDGKWQVEQPDDETLEKIHGIYNYEG